MEVSEYFKNNRDSKSKDPKNRNSAIDKETSNGIMSENNSKWSGSSIKKSPTHQSCRDNASVQKRSEPKPIWNTNNETSKSNWKNKNKNRNERSDNWNKNRNRNSERTGKDHCRDKYPPVNVYNPNMYNSATIISKQTKADGQMEMPVENVEKIDEQSLSEEKANVQDRAKTADINKQVELLKPTVWKPKRIDTSTPEGMIQQNVRLAQGYLNKMSHVTFESLSEKFVEIALMENGNPPLPGQLKILIDRIFEQALLQPTFCHMYSLLCEKIHKKMKIFRMVLLNKCQEEFELGTVERNNDMDEIEKEDHKFKTKKRMLSNINFIAELFKTNVIVEPVMYECFNHLLKNQTKENPDEEQIEAVCKLMINVGNIIDPDRVNKRIDGYILQLKDLQKCNVSARIRFMIDDLVDIRDNSWSSLR